MGNLRKVFLVFFAVLFSASCAMTPYSSKFQCPDPYMGECTSVPRAYEKVVEEGYNPPDTQEEVEKKKEKKKETTSRSERKSSSEKKRNVRDVYSLYLMERMTDMLEKPDVPIITPPRVMRMLILPYTDKTGTVYSSPRYVYFIVENPRFILDARGVRKR